MGAETRSAHALRDLSENWDENLIEDVPDVVAVTIIELQAHVAALPDERREVIKARYFDSVQQKDLAHMMDSSRMRVHRLEKRAIAALRRELCEVA